MEFGHFLWHGTPARGTGRCLLLGIGNKKVKKMGDLLTQLRNKEVKNQFKEVEIERLAQYNEEKQKKTMQ